MILFLVIVKLNKEQAENNPRNIVENETSKEETFTHDQASVKNNLPVSVTLRKQINIEMSENESQIINSCIKIGNTLVFTDYSNSRLIICNSDGTDIHHIPLSDRPRYITEIDSNTVAVSCLYDSTILIINISTRSVTSTINTSGYCYGISYNDNNLYVVIDGSIIHVMDLTGKVIRTIPIPTSAVIFDITVDRDRLVCIDGSSIYCCSLDGKVMWKFKKDEFQDLRRVTTDDEGNVYVTIRKHTEHGETLEQATSVLEQVHGFLNDAAATCAANKPRYNAKPKLNVWSPDIKLALDEMRKYYAQWVKQGKIKDPENNIYQQRLRTKKEFRRQVRIENAKVKDTEKQRIMETRTKDTKLFHQLVRSIERTGVMPMDLHQRHMYACKRVPTKIKLLTGTYILQPLRYKIYKEGTEDHCIACECKEETLEHLLIECEAWNYLRDPILQTIKNLLTTNGNVQKNLIK
ncbi:unnamed protein product [Mytilus edulis]|uniref:Reverse transcriptase zinc-binding domain-containing protein n=1 Tax=Mytilus edulis TaxID=6550 RepID=A0A8S3VN51_MYTED|nr:unnamed protein product [Mytilus edulis]